jgi:DNA-binding LytR/AlgR family response regulator
MKVIIIEDEKPAAQKLKGSLREINPKIDVVAVLNDVASSVSWLRENAHPDLIFMDINLSDGLCFNIFGQTTIQCPVIFTTAYDDYWQKAFEHNCIDYLLKPVKLEKIAQTLQKYDLLKKHFSENIGGLFANLKTEKQDDFKKRFLVKKGTEYFSIKTDDIAYFYSAHKMVCLVDRTGQKFIMDFSLNDLEGMLDHTCFFRINRQFLVNREAIIRIRSLPKTKLEIELQPAFSEEITIGQEIVPFFKSWIGN